MYETTVQAPDSTCSDIRQRLLNAAGEVFAEQGFKDATVREICKKAGANLASVNYHFGGKERLYSEVLRHADQLSMEKHPPFVPDLAARPPEDQLAWFIRQFLHRVFDTGRPTWHDRLISREMVDPTPALAELAERNIKPRALALQAIVRAMLGEGAEEKAVQMCAASIVGQCLMYHRCRLVVEHLMPAIPLGSEDAVETLTNHITEFSISAIRRMRDGEGRP